MGGCCHKQKAHHRTSSAPLGLLHSPLQSISEQKSKPSILVDSDSFLDSSPKQGAFYAQKVLRPTYAKEDREDEEDGLEEEGTGVVFPIKFVDKGGKRGKSSVPRIRLAGTLTVISENKASDSRREDSAKSDFSFSKPRPDAAWEQNADNESQEISEESPVSGFPPVEVSSSCATEGRQLLPPIIKSPGRPLLLKPLNGKSGNLEAPGDFKLKRGSTQTTAQQELKDGYMTLRGKFRYILGSQLHVADSLCTQVLCATSRGKGFVVYQYNKKKLKHMLLMRGRTALDVIQAQIDMMSSIPPHPHIAQLEEVIQTDTRFYVILDTEYSEALLNLCPIEESFALELFGQMIAAVSHLHGKAEAGHFDLRPSSFHLTKKGDIEMSWLHPVLPLSTLQGGEAKDSVALCAILLTMVQGHTGVSEDIYEEVLEQLSSGNISSDMSVSAPLQEFLSFCVSAGSSLSPAQLTSQPWLQSLT